MKVSTLRRWMKKWGYRWKRSRKSLLHKRNQEDFEKAHQWLKSLKKKEEQGRIDLYFFDEMGVNLIPSVPYAWQLKGKRILLPSVPSANLTVLGFMSRTQPFKSFLFQEAANSEIVIECFDRFASDIIRPTIVVLDNAPTHRSHRFKEQIEKWRDKGLTLFFIPPYSPELNLIERLWKEIKYTWLPKYAYTSKQGLEKQIIYILENIGEKFSISFQ
ncbi:IS630 family transposase [Limibacter armeniacum]|uniref:IS630 family transposase n=1 Tax=Limibacter armeniacum TaxID=466084 RepID=UPI002FE66AD6